MKEPITKFNKKNYYNDKIKAKLDELKVLCNNEKLPFFFAVAVNSTEKKTEYEYEFIGTNPNEIYLNPFPECCTIRLFPHPPLSSGKH